MGDRWQGAPQGSAATVLPTPVRLHFFQEGSACDRHQSLCLLLLGPSPVLEDLLLVCASGAIEKVEGGGESSLSPGPRF